MLDVDIIQQVRKDGKVMMDVNLCMKEVGKRIMERRKKMGLTQEQLAEKCFEFPRFLITNVT